jgi:hypothetical protein
MMFGAPDFTCPCCGYVVFDEAPGSYLICPICFWEDDLVQLLNPTFSGGANKTSLLEAQRNYKEFGATERRFIKHARKPKASDVKDPTWRRIDAASHYAREFTGSVIVKGTVVLESAYYWRRSAV